MRRNTVIFADTHNFAVDRYSHRKLCPLPCYTSMHRLLKVYTMYLRYPEIRPYAEHRIQTHDGQCLFVEECGSPNGLPVVVLHEGPGLGCQPWHRQFFDPEAFRIILFDQRGCGRSTPSADLGRQSLNHLIVDAELVRQTLNVDQWLLFGCDWGGLLGLLYAHAYPQHVLGFIGVGISLATSKEIRWRYAHGANLFFPDYWEDLCRSLAVQSELTLDALRQRLAGNDEIARMSAAKAWALWHGRLATRHSDIALIEWMTEPHRAITFAALCAHFYQAEQRPTESQIADAARTLDQLAHCALIHGRFDMLSPLTNAWQVIEHAPHVHLDIIRDAGHSILEPAITDAIVRTTRQFARRLRG